MSSSSSTTPVCTASSPSSSSSSSYSVAIVGAGITGLAAARYLSHTLSTPSSLHNPASSLQLTLWESASRAGGHAKTEQIGEVCVDTGFMVCNAVTYPNMLQAFQEADVEMEKSDMSLSVSFDQGQMEWSSDGVDGVFAQRRRLLDPYFVFMLKDVLRFKEDALRFLADEEQTPSSRSSQVTLGQFIESRAYTNYFRDYYLIPVCASVWSCPQKETLQFPAVFILTFMRNHHLLQLTNRPQWLCVKGRSQQYVQKLSAPFAEIIRLNAHVVKVQINDANGFITLTLENGESHSYNSVIFSTHPPDTLRMLGSEATANERRILGAFHYQDNEVVLHTDESFMPIRKNCWASWNFLGETDTTAQSQAVTLTYYLNRLQNLKTDQHIFVTLNPKRDVDPTKVISRTIMAHPVPTTTSVSAIDELPSIQGIRGLYFAGAWAGYGFHEDGFKAGEAVAAMLALRIALNTSIQKQLTLSNSYSEETIIKSENGISCNCNGYHIVVSSINQNKINELENDHRSCGVTNGYGECSASAVISPRVPLAAYHPLENPVSFNEQLGLFSLASICRYLVLRFLSHFIQRGQVSLYEVGGSVETFGKPKSGLTHTLLRVIRPDFYTKVALRGDLGLADAYIAGDFTCSRLLDFLQLLIFNRDVNQQQNSGRFSMSGLLIAPIKNSISYLLQSYLKRNTPLQSRSNIRDHYDTGNEFFQLFLDPSMTYSCAYFEHPCQSLYDAQVNKVNKLVSGLRLRPGLSVLEIGSGWGFLSRHIARQYKCKVTCLTLSHEQLEFCQRRASEERLDHMLTYELVDYRLFGLRNAHFKAFHRIVSCEMLEAVGHEFLGDFYRHCDRLLAPNGLISVQVIAFPDSKYDEYRTNIDFIRERIFPGGLCPSFTALMDAMTLHSSFVVEAVENIGPHYAHTLGIWRNNLRNASSGDKERLQLNDECLRKWDYYFVYCQAGFSTRSLQVYHILYSRTCNNTQLGVPFDSWSPQEPTSNGFPPKFPQETKNFK